jgi:hypothetical protein
VPDPQATAMTTDAWKLGIAIAAVLLLATSSATPPPDVKYPDGAVASATARCADGDLCGSVQLSNGDTIDVYSEGAAYCKPYMLKVVRLHGGTVILSSDVELHKGQTTDVLGNANCQSGFTESALTLDQGEVRMVFNLNGDGTLSARFDLPASAAPAPQNTTYPSRIVTSPGEPVVIDECNMRSETLKSSIALIPVSLPGGLWALDLKIRNVSQATVDEVTIRAQSLDKMGNVIAGGDARLDLKGDRRLHPLPPGDHPRPDWSQRDHRSQHAS